ncbi:MAG: hypothetical protein ACFFKA_05560 [Candidatus Thorarchaeota archaeon]
MSKNAAGFVILSLISISALGLGGYSYYLTLISPHIYEDRGLILVGIWDELYYNTDYVPYTSTSYWLLEYGGNKLNNSYYLSVSNNNTRITFLKPGWYRIQLTMVLSSIDAGSWYWIIILKNGVQEFYLLYHETSGTPESDYLTFDSDAYVYSDGTDYFEILGDSNTEPFFPGASQIYNQLTIECVV